MRGSIKENKFSGWVVAWVEAKPWEQPAREGAACTAARWSNAPTPGTAACGQHEPEGSCCQALFVERAPRDFQQEMLGSQGRRLPCGILHLGCLSLGTVRRDQSPSPSPPGPYSPMCAPIDDGSFKVRSGGPWWTKWAKWGAAAFVWDWFYFGSDAFSKSWPPNCSLGADSRLHCMSSKRCNSINSLEVAETS